MLTPHITSSTYRPELRGARKVADDVFHIDLFSIGLFNGSSFLFGDICSRSRARLDCQADPLPRMANSLMVLSMHLQSNNASQQALHPPSAIRTEVPFIRCIRISMAADFTTARPLYHLVYENWEASIERQANASIRSFALPR